MSKDRNMLRLESLLATWEYIRDMTYDYIDSVPDNKLVDKLPRPFLDQIGQHFLEMGDVTKAYAAGFDNGVVDFEGVRWQFPSSEVKSKKMLRKHLKESDKILNKAIKAAIRRQEEQFELAGEKVSLGEMLLWLILHEVLHHGQLVAFGYLLGTTFPESWVEQWALPEQDTSEG